MKTADGKITVKDRVMRLEGSKEKEAKQEEDAMFADKRTLYVAKLPLDTTKEDLEERFGKHGKVLRVWIAFVEKPSVQVCMHVCVYLH